MSEIKSVAVAGASGELGPYIVKALLDAGFQVTALTRSKKPGALDARVKVVEVDFTSVESLTTALRGMDAVVSAVGGAAIMDQGKIIDAAVAAGVKRFIPSEYGSCTTHPDLQALPVYGGFFQIRKDLQEKAAAGQITWTVVAVGAFMEFLFDKGMFLDFANHKASLFDEGDNRTSSTSMVNVGKAIAQVLKNFEATKNKIVRVSEVILTQNELLRIAKELQPEIDWQTSKVPTSALLKAGVDSAKSGDFSMPVIFKIIGGTAMAGDTYGAAFDETDNKLLGVQEMTKEGLRQRIAGKLV